MTTQARRIASAIIGAVYAIGFALWGALMSGGGHFNLLFVLFTSPAGVGLLFWPLWGYLTAGAMSRSARIAFICTIGVHYAALVYYLYGENSDLYWFRIGNQQSVFGFLVVVSVVAYLGGQLFLWWRFVKTDDVQ